ncbi:ervatamin-B-like [Neltuma alba]|uniref:ervatamin-B-like n=1 Tax=Neltuma alba TaxID=207710 RepID=UPI0010A4AA81|nr:ervatamin-B-like [Prosopis alba]
MAFYSSMSQFLFPLIWCSILICLSSGFPTSESSVSPSKAEQDFDMFQQWMVEHGRVYQDSEESKTRFQILQRNLKYITVTNPKRSNSSGAYRLGLNKFADMSPEEFKRVYLHPLEVPTTIAPGTSRSGHTQQNNSCENAPSSMDWRQKRVVTPVKNQKKCGSCWAFAAIESVNAIRTGELVRLSEQELVDCDLTDHDCSGGLPVKAFKWVVQNGGLSKEDDYPYVREKGYCKAEKQSVVKINGYEGVEQTDDALLCAIANHPITVGLDATPLRFYQGGIIDGENCPMGTQPNHAVLIVGYDSKDGKDYWIVKNSWGEDWGMNGYFMIQRNSNAPNGVCSINTAASYPTI